MLKKFLPLYLSFLFACAAHTSWAMKEDIITIPNPAFIPEEVSIASLRANDRLPMPGDDGFWNLADKNLESLDGLDKTPQPEEISGLKVSHNRLRSLPERMLPLLTHLDISHNPLGKMPPGMIHGLHTLRRFFACAIQMQEIPPDFFDDTPSLKVIDVSDNQLATLPSKLFHSVPALEKLVIAKNKLSSLDPLSLSYQANLKFLNASHNQLRTIPSQLCHALSKLEDLDLNSNEISCFQPDSFRGLGALTELNCARNTLTHLDPLLFGTCSSLIELNIAHNLLTTLDAALIEPLTALRALNLRGNPEKLKNELPEKVKLILQQRSLFLGDPLFVHDAHTPKTIRDLVAELTLQKRMHEIYYSDPRDNEAYIIDLNGCCLSDIDALPELFPDTMNVVTINAQNNYLSKLPCTAVNPFANLRTLDLRNNLITSLGRLRLPRLLYLPLSDNQVTNIPRTALSDLPRLAVLDLSHNEIAAIEDGAFDALEKLECCTLDNNRLNGIPPHLFASEYTCLNRLEELDLSHNSLGSCAQYSLPSNISLQFFPQCPQPLQTLAAQKIMAFLDTQTPHERLKKIQALPEEHQKIFLPIASYKLRLYLMLADHIKQCRNAFEVHAEKADEAKKTWLICLKTIEVLKWDDGLTLFFEQLSAHPLHAKFLQSLCLEVLKEFGEIPLAQLAEKMIVMPKPLYDRLLGVTPPNLQCRLAAAQDVYKEYLTILQAWKEKCTATLSAHGQEISLIEKKFSDASAIPIARYQEWSPEMQCAFFELINNSIKTELKKHGIMPPRWEPRKTFE